MYVINTKGFKPEDKVSICNNYILPETNGNIYVQ